MITLPANFITDLIGVMQSTFSDLLPLILLIVGVVLGVWVITNLIWGFKEKQQQDYFNNK
jgi:hypothetical protein